jgi:hypothetical protein
MKYPEEAIQQAVVKFLDSKNLLYTSSPTGVYLGIKPATRLKRKGCKAGVPDILIFEPRGKWHGLMIELKSANGKPSNEQIEWQAALSAKNYQSIICPKFKTDQECYDWAISEIEKYLDLK